MKKIFKFRLVVSAFRFFLEYGDRGGILFLNWSGVFFCRGRYSLFVSVFRDTKELVFICVREVRFGFV